MVKDRICCVAWYTICPADFVIYKYLTHNTYFSGSIHDQTRLMNKDKELKKRMIGSLHVIITSIQLKATIVQKNVDISFVVVYGLQV